MRKVEAIDEQAAEFVERQVPAVRLGSALLVEDSAAGIVAYLSHGSVVEPTPSDREVYNAS